MVNADMRLYSMENGEEEVKCSLNRAMVTFLSPFRDYEMQFQQGHGDIFVQGKKQKS